MADEHDELIEALDEDAAWLQVENRWLRDEVLQVRKQHRTVRVTTRVEWESTRHGRSERHVYEFESQHPMRDDLDGLVEIATELGQRFLRKLASRGWPRPQD